MENAEKYRNGDQDIEKYKSNFTDSEIEQLETEAIQELEYLEDHADFDWDECICNSCGYIWYASKTENFNFTFCEECHSCDIGGNFNEG